MKEYFLITVFRYQKIKGENGEIDIAWICQSPPEEMSIIPPKEILVGGNADITFDIAMYTTYPEAQERIKHLPVGPFYQIQKIFAK